DGTIERQQLSQDFLLRHVQRRRLLDAKAADARAPQRFEKRAAAEAFAEVAGQGADVRSFAAANFNLQVWKLVANDVDGVDVDAGRRQVRILAAPRQFVGATAGHLGRREGRRRLLDLTDKLNDRFAHPLERRRLRRWFPGYFPFSVVAGAVAAQTQAG